MYKLIGKELELLLTDEKIKLKELSSILDIPYSTLSNYKNDVSSPDIKMLRIIKQRYLEKKGKNIDLNWLITGKGEMFIEKKPINNDELQRKIDERFNELKKDLINELSQKNNS